MNDTILGGIGGGGTGKVAGIRARTSTIASAGIRTRDNTRIRAGIGARNRARFDGRQPSSHRVIDADGGI